MSCIESLDLELFVTTAVEDVFDTMLSMDVSKISPDEVETNGYPQIVGTVSVAGSIMGNVNVHLNNKFAKLITAAMLGMTVMVDPTVTERRYASVSINAFNNDAFTWISLVDP